MGAQKNRLIKTVLLVPTTYVLDEKYVNYFSVTHSSLQSLRKVYFFLPKSFASSASRTPDYRIKVGCMSHVLKSINLLVTLCKFVY